MGGRLIAARDPDRLPARPSPGDRPRASLRSCERTWRPTRPAGSRTAGRCWNKLVLAALAARDLGTATALVANTADLLQRSELLDESERAAAELARAGAADPIAVATAALAGAGVWAHRGRHPRVAELAARAVALGDAIGPQLRLDALATLGSARTMCGEPEAALVALTAALELAATSATGAASTRRSSAWPRSTAWRPATSTQRWRTPLGPWRWPTRAATSRTGRWRGSARPGFTWLAATRNRPGSWPLEALRLCRETGDRVGEAWCLLLSADAATAAGNPGRCRRARRPGHRARRAAVPAGRGGGSGGRARPRAGRSGRPARRPRRDRASTPPARGVRRPGRAPLAGGARRRAGDAP